MSVYATRDPEYYAPLLDRFGAIEPPLLDLGAGEGLFLVLAARRGIEVCGVEGSEERVEICERKGLDVKHHDLADPLPFEDETFGTAYCGQVIEHLHPDAQRMTLSEAHRVLKPGGKLQVRSPCRHWEPARVPGHDHLLTPSELEAMLRESGFESIDMSLNYPQEIPEMPADLVKKIWKSYRPDLLSTSAHALCTK